MALSDAATEAGADISLDTYPSLSGATTLSAILPSWASAGSSEETILSVVGLAMAGLVWLVVCRATWSRERAVLSDR